VQQKACTALKFDNTATFAYNKCHLMQYDTAVCDLQAGTLRQCVRRKVKADLSKNLLAEPPNQAALMGCIEAAEV